MTYAKKVNVTATPAQKGPHCTECRKLQSNTKCRFNQRCTYKHSVKNYSIYHNEIYKIVANITLKHEHEINIMNEDMNNLKFTITDMGNQLQMLKKELTKHSEAEQEVQIVKEVNTDSGEKYSYNNDNEINN